MPTHASEDGILVIDQRLVVDPKLLSMDGTAPNDRLKTKRPFGVGGDPISRFPDAVSRAAQNLYGIPALRKRV